MTKTKTGNWKPSAVVVESQLQDGVLDIDEASEVIPFNYSIASYGTDYPVDGLVSRLRENGIVVPVFGYGVKRGRRARFQRQYVWSKQQADRFIESLLLGLPVPGIFLMREESGRLLVLDGHQRLRTMQRFLDGMWDEETPFELDSVQERFRGRSYASLSPSDRRRLDDAVIHATIIKQEDPADGLSSVYLIFERLNSGGTALQPQEIRVALYHGPFADLLLQLNEFKAWRALFGKRSGRLKDMELILRFFALMETRNRYKRPMKGFLNAYMARRQGARGQLAENMTELFERTTQTVLDAIGKKALKPKSSVNAALADAVMVGLATRLQASSLGPAKVRVRRAYRELLGSEIFQGAIAKATADEENVRKRLELAIDAFAGV